MLPASLSARWVQKEFVEATAAGGCCTIIAYLTMLLLFIIEILTFMSTSTSSSLSLSQAGSETLQINFDIDMFDIECRNLRVVVVDATGKDIVQSTSRDFKLRSFDMRGADRGMHQHVFGPEEEEELELAHQQVVQRLEAEDGKAELDADWASSHDGFKHKSFEHVIEAHDLTVINFFAEWCSHCRKFSPLWGEIAQDINQKAYTDHGGHKREVKALKVNCVDFRRMCFDLGIDEFPTIRAFRSDGSSSRFEGKRSKEAIITWVASLVDMKADGWAKHHTELQSGCNAAGFIQVPRMPGNLKFFAGSGHHALDPTMTNVSHRVKHLSFSDAMWKTSFTWAYLPSDVSKHTHPLDSQEFCTSKFHETFEHNLILVSTTAAFGIHLYQFSHYHRISTTANKSDVPQATFNFDIEGFGVKLASRKKAWYEFVTSTMAILGGTFVMIKLFSFGSRAAAKTAAKSFKRPKSIRSAVNAPGLRVMD
mmetsp:Transcript_98717/g.156062  ORF Transcript_98717/g.156062 Transcript_98717/m.156062 type:complete len:480 (-) Transcript_98717:70-1509(-)